MRASVLQHLPTLLATARHVDTSTFKIPFNITGVLSLPESAFRYLLPTDVSYLSHTKLEKIAVSRMQTLLVMRQLHLVSLST